MKAERREKFYAQLGCFSIQRGGRGSIFLSSVSRNFEAEGGLLFEFASWRHVVPLLPEVLKAAMIVYSGRHPSVEIGAR